MTMKTELSDLELQSHDGTLRGQNLGAGELEVVAWRERPANAKNTPLSEKWWRVTAAEPSPDYLEAVRGFMEVEPLTPLLPARERIRALEEERDRLSDLARLRLSEFEGMRARLAKAVLRSDEIFAEVTNLSARLERLRKVVRLAIRQAVTSPKSTISGLRREVDAITEEDRVWAEGWREEES